MCEEHLYWILVMVFINLDKYYMRDLMMVPNKFFSNLCFDLYGKVVNRVLYNQAYQQGTARLGDAMIQKVGIEDLEALSAFLGTKQWMMGGEKPSEIDCVVFAFVQW